MYAKVTAPETSHYVPFSSLSPAKKVYANIDSSNKLLKSAPAKKKGQYYSPTKAIHYKNDELENKTAAI